MMAFHSERCQVIKGIAQEITGSRIGVRESRRIKGEYKLTADDITKARKLEDTIACSAYPMDIHAPTPKETHTDIYVSKGQVYDIPYGCLVPQKVNRLLVAGRCISTSHKAHASTCVSPTFMAFG